MSIRPRRSRVSPKTVWIISVLVATLFNIATRRIRLFDIAPTFAWSASALFAVLFAWLAVSYVVRRRREKEENQNIAWRKHIQGRDIRK